MGGRQTAPVLPEQRTALFGILTAVLTLLAILVLGEIGARLFSEPHPLPAPPPPQAINPYQPNPYVVSMRPYLFFHIPGARYAQKILARRNDYQINARGFRGPEIDPLPPPGRKRLLVLGDSVVEGHGIRFEETFARHLGDTIAGQGWEVINLGVQGASPLYFAANLERYHALNSDAVLVLVHENDLYDDEQREKTYFTLPLLDDRAALCSGGREHSLAARSRLYGLLATTWSNFSRSPLEELIAANGAQPGIHAGKTTAQGRSSFAVPLDRYAQRWAMSSAYLTLLRDELRRRDIPLLLAGLCTVTLALPANEGYAAQCASLEEHSRQWAQAHSVPYLSLAPTMRQAFQEHRLDEILLLNDFHPTPLTHGLLAEALSPFVSASLAGKASSAPPVGKNNY